MSLLKFKGDGICLSTFVQPICLWEEKIEPPVTENFVIGWDNIAHYNLNTDTKICNGDSGGGLTVGDNGIYWLRGVVSVSLIKSDDCEDPRTFVYTNISEFRDWIKNITGSE